MKFINNFKIILLLVLSIFLFSGCFSKSSSYDYSSFYKNSNNSDINNSLAMHKATMRPYTVFGVQYVPAVAKIGDDFTGIASWYGPDFHAKKTSNGETYNMYDMTAAHKTLPMNTVVRVDNLENGRATTVRINDRGPFVSGRIIDLSNKAAHQIDMVGKGTATVKITVLGYNGQINNNNISDISNKNETLTLNNSTDYLELKDDTITSTEVSNLGKQVEGSKNSINFSTVSGSFNIQVGAFSLVDGAKKTQNSYQQRFPSRKVEYIQNGGIYRVFIRGFGSYEDAQNFKNSNNITNAIVVQ